MIILSHLYTHLVHISLFSLNYMFKSNMAIIGFKCKLEVIAQELYYLLIFLILSEVIVTSNIKLVVRILLGVFNF
jgi:hypothetical protein